MKITAEDFLHQENDGTSGRTEINEKQRSEKIRNEERTAPIEVEILGCIPYDNNVSAGSAKGENIFELDSENPAFMEVAKIMQNRLDIAR